MLTFQTGLRDDVVNQDLRLWVSARVVDMSNAIYCSYLL